MKETAGKNLPLALRSRPWGVSAAKIDVILPYSRSGCSIPLQRSPTAPSPSASPRRDRDLAFGVPGSGIPSCGATIRRSAGVAMRHLDCRILSVSPLTIGTYAAALSCTGLRISLVRVTSCHPRLLRCLPVGPRRYRGYRGGLHTRSCPARTATAFEAAPHVAFWQSNLLL